MNKPLCLSLNKKPPKILGYLALGAILLAPVITPAFADNGRGPVRQNYGRPNQRDHYRQRQTQDRVWNDHEGRARRYWQRPYFQPEPHVVYAPPVIYAPPPMYEQPGINLIFPLHIR